MEGKQVRDVLQSVMDLQPEWTSENTEAMQLRGYFVRADGPDWIRERLGEFATAMPPSVDDLAAEGRDGTGPKAEVPWFRLYSRSRSERARFGFYLVYLFDRPGDAVYLSLNQGTTRWEGGDFKPLPPELLATRVAWARRHVLQAGGDLRETLAEFDLRADTPLARGYERGNIAALRYGNGAVPDPMKLRDDLVWMSSFLGMIYTAQDAADVPGEQPAEVAAVEEAAAQAAGRPGATQRAGFRPDAVQRRAIENRAMEVASAHLASDGWSVRDVSAKESFDLEITRGAETVHVEVKGTTSVGESVLLTRREVEHHLSLAPSSALVVVSEVVLTGGQAPIATGGKVRVIAPWSIRSQDLRAIAYTYAVPSSDSDESQIESSRGSSHLREPGAGATQGSGNT
jgi:hypothetical protein